MTKPSKKNIDPLLLEAYFDRELSPGEREMVSQNLSKEDLQRLQFMGDLHVLLKDAHEEAIRDVDFDPLWKALEGEIQQRSSPKRNSKWSWSKVFGNSPFFKPALGLAFLALFLMAPFWLISESSQEKIQPKVDEKSHSPSTQVAEKSPDLSSPSMVVIISPDGQQKGWVVTRQPQSSSPVLWYVGQPTQAQPSQPVQSQTAPQSPQKPFWKGIFQSEHRDPI